MKGKAWTPRDRERGHVKARTRLDKASTEREGLVEERSSAWGRGTRANE